MAFDNNTYTVRAIIVWEKDPTIDLPWDILEEFNQLLYDSFQNGLVSLSKSQSTDGLTISREMKDRPTAEEWKTKTESLIEKYNNPAKMVSYTIVDI